MHAFSHLISPKVYKVGATISPINRLENEGLGKSLYITCPVASCSLGKRTCKLSSCQWRPGSKQMHHLNYIKKKSSPPTKIDSLTLLSYLQIAKSPRATLKSWEIRRFYSCMAYLRLQSRFLISLDLIID